MLALGAPLRHRSWLLGLVAVAALVAGSLPAATAGVAGEVVRIAVLSNRADLVCP